MSEHIVAGDTERSQRTIGASAGRRLWFSAIVVLVAGIALGAWVGGRDGARSVGFGALVAIALQVTVARLSLPGSGVASSGVAASNVDAFASAMLRALAFGAVIRLFGGVIAVVVVLKSGRVDPLPFLAGFGGAYVVLEVELARALIALESRMRSR